MQTILRVLVGSQAHGLATAESDQDFRRVYVMPTEQMFHLGFKYPSTQWTKTGGDETAWEVGQFLMHGHPMPPTCPRNPPGTRRHRRSMGATNFAHYSLRYGLQTKPLQHLRTMPAINGPSFSTRKMSARPNMPQPIFECLIICENF